MAGYSIFKRILSCTAAFLMLSFPAYSQDIPSEAPILDTQIQMEASENLWALTDRSRDTRYTWSGDMMTIESPTPISSLYILWDRPPAPWSLDTGTTVVPGGSNGFLHELIRLDSPVSTLSLSAQGQQQICELYLFGEGTVPDWVQQWRPPYEDADMLLLPTHADDEHLYFGGTMPLYAGERGYKVQVAYMTNHWAQRVRPHELLDGLWTVGITAYPVISDFVDQYCNDMPHAASIYGEESVTAWQVEQLRRFHPEVVVGHDINGEYGHGAHILNAHTLQKAVPLSSDPGYAPESAALYGVWEPQKVYLHLWPEGSVVMNWDQPLSAFGGKTAFEMAVQGFSKHVSQQEYFKVLQSGPYDCRKFGLVHTAVGPDLLGADFFENVTFPAPPEESSSLPSDISSTDSEPEIAPPAENTPDEESPGERSPLLIPVIVLLSVVLAVALLSLLLVFRKQRGGKRRL